MGENLLHQKTHAPGLISVGLSSSYCTCPDLKGAQTKENKGVELSQNAPRTCTSSWLYSHPRVYSIIFFIFYPLYLLQFRLESSPLSLYSPHLWKTPHPPFFLPPVPPPWTSSASAPPRNKAMQSSSTIFSHIYSFSLRFVKRLRQFYTVFPSGSAPFSALIVFQRRLYVLKTLNTITAPAILKN